MSFVGMWRNFYFHPRQVLYALADMTTPRYGALCALIRGLMLALLQYLPFYLLKFTPVSPASLPAFDTPDYFLYAVFIWPIFIPLSWAYLGAATYVALRLFGYPAKIDQVLNLSGLLNLAIGAVIIAFDWLTVPFGLHSDYMFTGIVHMVLSDPWSFVISAYFFKKFYGVPVWISLLLTIVVRILYFPIAIVFIRT